MKRYLTKCLDTQNFWTLTKFLDLLLDTAASAGKGTQNFVGCLIIVLLSTYPVVCFINLRENQHILFWMGKLPVFLNLGVPVTLYSMLLIVPILTCTAFSRKCLRRTLLAWFLVNGSVLIGYGLYIVKSAFVVSNELVYTCGSGELTAKVQKEWERLNSFHQACMEHKGENDIFIQQCPGFEDMEQPPHDEMVEYIMDMEMDFNCQGFCQFWKKPLFNVESYTGERCASRIGDQVLGVGFEVGLPLMSIGVLIILVGICLANYDHL